MLITEHTTLMQKSKLGKTCLNFSYLAIKQEFHLICTCLLNSIIYVYFCFFSIFLHQNVFATKAGFFPPHFCILCSVHNTKDFTRHEVGTQCIFVSESPVHIPFLFGLFIYSCNHSAHIYGAITQCWLLL